MKRWNLLTFDRFVDARGNLTAIESGVTVPFEIRRVYYIYDVPGGSTRAGHAHKALHQVYIALSGSFDVFLDDGVERETIHLNLPSVGLHIKPGVWRELTNFSSGSTCFALASEHFAEDDYIRNRDDFRRYVALQQRLDDTGKAD